MIATARRILTAILLAAASATPVGVASAVAQSLDGKTVDNIVGSDVKQDEATASAKEGRVLAAIDRTADNIGTVRKTSNVDQVDIVFLSDTARSEGGPPPRIAEKIEEHRDEVAELRQEIEANALLYHAIDSRRVLMGDVLAVEFEDGARKVVVYAAAKPTP